MLKSFIKGIINDDQQAILNINNIIRKTEYPGLLLETDELIKIDIDAINNLNVQVIDSHIEKCKTKIRQKDFTGAITNARSLLEIVYLKIIKDNGDDINLVKGYLIKMYSMVKEIFQLNKEQDQLIDI